MSGIFDHIARLLSQHLGLPLQINSHRQVFGGNINHTYCLYTSAGTFFLKLNANSFPCMFQKEFEGLQLLHQTLSIKIPLPVVYGSFDDSTFLITEFIEEGGASKNFWQTFANQLASLHRYSNSRFGLSSANYIGMLAQQNNYCDSWQEFYTTQRLQPLMQLAFNQNKCSEEDLIAAEKLCDRLYNLLPEAIPALVHGDLWSGNFMCDRNGSPVIYDPAVYYGNREMDIAMSLLFGGFDKSFYDFYNEAFPLQPGWKSRVPLHNLYPLLVHLILFGGGYYHKVINIIKAYS